MMPLSEISNNVRRSTSNVRDKTASDAASASTPSLPPRAVQSMLKTSTELGDLGRFALRPSRLPRSGSRLHSSRPRSGSFDASFASALRHERSSHARRHGRHHHHQPHHGSRPTVSSSGFSARNVSQSNLSSYTNASRRRRYPPGPHPYPLQGLASPGPSQRSLHHHRSLITLRSHGSMAPPSPMMRRGPGPMGGPPYRAGSPAYSEIRYMSHSPQPGFIRAPSVGAIGSSPGPVFPRHHGLPGYRPDLNASYTSLSRMPSPAISYRGPSPYAVHAPIRTSTPSPGFAQPQYPTLSHNSLAAMPRSPTGSSIPQYYDYSESFVEENCFSPDAVQDPGQPPLNMDQTILESVPSPARDAQTPFGTKEGSSFLPVELPTSHNRRLSEHSKTSFSGVIPKRISSLGAPALHKGSPEMINIRRTRSQDSGTSDMARADRDERRASLTSKRSPTPAKSSVFFPNAARSSRDLTTLAARVHSPPVGAKHKVWTNRIVDASSVAPETTLKTPTDSKIKRSPRGTLPTLTFSPISFEWYSPSPSARPRTSEAAPIRKAPKILSPMPERPMSSQSRKRFSKILEMEESFDSRDRAPKSLNCLKPPTLGGVDEASDHRLSVISSVSSLSSSRILEDSIFEAEARISHVTSHDKSTIESLLDKHIECLGLSPEANVDTDTTNIEDREVDCLSSGGDTIKLCDLLASVPSWKKDRPMTSSSYRHPSLATVDRQKLKPRRLFASMDANIPHTISERPTPAFSSTFESQSKGSRPSFGWQTLPSISQLASARSTAMPSITSGELADVDSSEQTKFKVRRRSNLSVSASISSAISKSASSRLTLRASPPHRRSKSEVIARQESHRRRRMRIRLKLTSKSRTMGDLASDGAADFKSEPNAGTALQKKSCTRHSSIKSPVQGYAELSGDSIMPSNTVSPRALSPAIPTRWSSIIAAMPEPVKKGAAVIRKASVRTVRSHKSNSSIVEPINNSRVGAGLPRIGSVPRLAPPEFGPPLTSSDLNLSLPYAEVPSTIRPTLRETKSFFSDDSFAQRQRTSLRQKLHLHSLRHVLPGSAGHGVNGHTPRRTPVKMNHACQLKTQAEEEESTLQMEMLGMSDFAYRKRKMLERLKGWWRRQCMSRVRRRKGERTAPGGVGW